MPKLKLYYYIVNAFCFFCATKEVVFWYFFPMKKGTKAVLRYLLLFIVVALATLISHLYFSSRSEVTYQAPPPAGWE